VIGRIRPARKKRIPADRWRQAYCPASKVKGRFANCKYFMDGKAEGGESRSVHRPTQRLSRSASSFRASSPGSRQGSLAKIPAVEDQESGERSRLELFARRPLVVGSASSATNRPSLILKSLQVASLLFSLCGGSSASGTRRYAAPPSLIDTPGYLHPPPLPAHPVSLARSSC
jgi:hypothetical protein